MIFGFYRILKNLPQKIKKFTYAQQTSMQRQGKYPVYAKM